MKERNKPSNAQDQPVQFSKGDAQRIAGAVHAFETGRRGRNPSKLPRAFSGGSGGDTPIRLGQFSGSWYNEPGASGADNVKAVKLFVHRPNADDANDWVPDLNQDGEEILAITLNLFSYIPTRSGNDSYMWCAVIPISDQSGEYWTGSYEIVDGQDVPLMTPYDKLWLLLAAEC